MTRFDSDVHTACTLRLWVTWDMISKDSDKDIGSADVVYPSLLSFPLSTPLSGHDLLMASEALFCSSVLCSFQAEMA